MSLSDLPVGLSVESLVFMLGTVAHQLAIHNTHCGQPAHAGYKSKVGRQDISKFCITCWPPAHFFTTKKVEEI